MTETPPPQPAWTPSPSPFSATGPVRKRSWPLSIEEAVTAAQAAGFQVTPRSKTNAAHVQRDWHTAASIRPVQGGGVVVSRPGRPLRS